MGKAEYNITSRRNSAHNAKKPSQTGRLVGNMMEYKHSEEYIFDSADWKAGDRLIERLRGEGKKPQCSMGSAHYIVRYTEKVKKQTKRCKYLSDDFDERCVCAESPYCTCWCPATDFPDICKYAEFEEDGENG